MGYRLTEEGIEFRKRLYSKGDDRSPTEGRILGVLNAVKNGKVLRHTMVSMRIGDSLKRMGISYLPFEVILEKLVEEGLVE